MIGTFNVGVGIIVSRGERILLARRSAQRDFAPSCWEFPAGRMEEGETIEETLKREGKEELGVIISDYHLVDAYTFTRHGKPMLLINYHCTINGEPRMSDEHDEFRWCSIDEARELLSFEQQIQTLERYRELNQQKLI